jgi:hypothetical protein
MTAALTNSSNGANGFQLDGYVYPQFLGIPLRPPTTQDIYNPFTTWQDNSANPPAIWYTTGAGRWYEFSNSAFGVASVTGTSPILVNGVSGVAEVGAVTLSLSGGLLNTVNSVVPVSGNINITAGNGIVVTPGTGAVAVGVVSGGFVVVPVAGTPQAMLAQHKYIANDSALTTFTLPTTSAVGDVIDILGSALNTNGWKVTYTTGQIIWGPAGSSTATSGNAASATLPAQAMSITCVVANTTWVITDNSGTITLT